MFVGDAIELVVSGRVNREKVVSFKAKNASSYMLLLTWLLVLDCHSDSLGFSYTRSSSRLL